MALHQSRKAELFEATVQHLQLGSSRYLDALTYILAHAWFSKEPYARGGETDLMEKSTWNTLGHIFPQKRREKTGKYGSEGGNPGQKI